MQLIADYYSFASPTVTGQWRIQVDDQAWQLGFRGGELALFEAPSPDHDLLSFLADIGAISESNLSILRSFQRSGREIDQALSEVVGGSAELLKLKRKHALHEIGRLLCLEASRADFSDLAPPGSTTLGVDALALPYVALRLQPPERLGSAVSAMLDKAYRLNRNPKVPVAGLQLDREALSVAKQFTRAIRLDSVEGIKHGGAGADALVARATVLTLVGAGMLMEAEPSAAPSSSPQAPPMSTPAPVERVRVGAPPVERTTAKPSQPPPRGERLAMPTVKAAPEPAPASPSHEAPGPSEPAPALGRSDASVALFLDAIDSRLLTDAETMLDRLTVSEAQRKVLTDYLAANHPRSMDPGAAMSAALAGLQEFTEAHPSDHLGPLLLSRIYHGADNEALARVFAQQAQRLGGSTDEVMQWKID